MTDRRTSADGLLLPKLLDLGLLAPELAQVVELGAPHVTAGHDLDPVDRRAVDRVGPLDTDAEADLPDLEGLPEAGALAADHDALEDLDTGTVSLDDPGVHLDGVAGPEGGKVGALRLGVEIVQRVHRCILVVLKRIGSSMRGWVLLIRRHMLGGSSSSPRGAERGRQPPYSATAGGVIRNPPSSRVFLSALSKDASGYAANMSGLREAVRSSD